MIDVGVVGASGYGGGELLRLLARHPQARLSRAISNTYAGKPLASAFPGMTGVSPLLFEEYGDGSGVAQCDVVFLAQENTKAMQTAPHLIEAGCKIVDLSADFRFRDQAVYAQWYGQPHAAPGLNAEAMYGMPELNKEAIRKARIIGNPGCHATAGILGLAPLMQHGLIAPNSIIIDSKTGVSGRDGRSSAWTTTFPKSTRACPRIKSAAHTDTRPKSRWRLAGWRGVRI